MFNLRLEPRKYKNLHFIFLTPLLTFSFSLALAGSLNVKTKKIPIDMVVTEKQIFDALLESATAKHGKSAITSEPGLRFTFKVNGYVTKQTKFNVLNPWKLDVVADLDGKVILNQKSGKVIQEVLSTFTTDFPKERVPSAKTQVLISVSGGFFILDTSVSNLEGDDYAAQKVREGIAERARDVVASILTNRFSNK